MLNHLLSEIISPAGSETKSGPGAPATTVDAEVGGARFAEFLQGEAKLEQAETGSVPDAIADSSHQVLHVRLPTALTEQIMENPAAAAPVDSDHAEASPKMAGSPADGTPDDLPLADPANTSGHMQTTGDDGAPSVASDGRDLPTLIQGPEVSSAQEPRFDIATTLPISAGDGPKAPGVNRAAPTGDVADGPGSPPLLLHAEPAGKVAPVDAPETRAGPASAPALPIATPGPEQHSVPQNKEADATWAPGPSATKEPKHAILPEANKPALAASDDDTRNPGLVRDGLNTPPRGLAPAFAAPPANDVRNVARQLNHAASVQHEVESAPIAKPSQHQAMVTSEEKVVLPRPGSQVQTVPKEYAPGHAEAQDALTFSQSRKAREKNSVLSVDPKHGADMPRPKLAPAQYSLREPETNNVSSAIPKDEAPPVPSRPLPVGGLGERPVVADGFAGIRASDPPVADGRSGKLPEDAAQLGVTGTPARDAHPLIGRISPAQPEGNSSNVGAQDGSFMISTLSDGVVRSKESEPEFITFRPIDSPVSAPDIAANRPDLARHVARQLAEIPIRMPDRPVELTLNPEELGRVRLTFTTTNAGLTVALTTERPETLEFMRRHIEILAREFHEIGYSSVNFEFGGDANRNPSPAPESGEPGFDPRGPAEDEAPPTPIKLSLDRTRGLDLRL